MLGALAGDMIGAPYEQRRIKVTSFPLWSAGSGPTDDSVLTLATAEALLDGGDFGEAYHRWYQRYPHAGYGASFHAWGRSARPAPYGSWGNGSAMRVSPAGWWARTLEEASQLGAATAAPTHDHPEGILGAQVVAEAVFLARTGAGKAALRERAARDYTLVPLDELRPTYRFDVSCRGTVPHAVSAVLEAGSFEEAVRLAISLGGDADTLACVAGAIAEALWGVPAEIEREVRARLDRHQRDVLDRFRAALAARG